MNFGELKASILAVIGRAPADICYDLVRADIHQRLRLVCMEATTTLTESASVALPADFLEVVSVYRDTDPRRMLTPVPAADVDRWHVSSGIPSHYAIVDGAMLLNPSPNGSENLEMRYLKKVDALSLDADTNVVLSDYPSVYVYGTLAHHAALIRDQANAQIWYAAYEKAIQQAQGDTNRRRVGGPPGQVMARTSA